ncbi:zf-HC2 domain-containing protein [Amycolatopsis sp. MtRt-6]|uniref:zf-HC2 domain-containing protein n=1 Tax=Amycolatopsis sp. MtRt-6 TaxID=2792782 RepID=UPI0035ABA85B
MLSAVTDGEAAPGEETAAELHLARCPACRFAAMGMVALTRWLRVRPVLRLRGVNPAYPPTASGSSRAVRRSSRARATRERIVPMGQSQTSAASA